MALHPLCFSLALQGYKDALAFASVGQTTGNNFPTDVTFHPDALARMSSDCGEFICVNASYILGKHDAVRVDLMTCWELAGYDFALTRQRSGAGFLDGDWHPSVASKLFEAACAYNELYLYTDATGLIRIQN